MIRPFTCLSVLLAAGSGLYLYSEKHRTTLLDDRIRAVVVDTHRVEDRTAMLRAEWALLNQPDRLGTLAGKFLPRLQPIAPTQFVQLAELARHLPPVGAPPPTAPMVALVVPPAVISPAMGGVPASGVPASGAVPAAAGVPQAVGGSAHPSMLAPVALASAVTAIPTPAPAATAATTPATARRIPAATAAHQALALRLAGLPRHAAASHHRVMVAALAPARAPASRELVDPVREAAFVPRAAPERDRAPPSAPVFAGSALGMAGATIAPPMAAR